MDKKLNEYTTKELTEELIKRDAISSEHILLINVLKYELTKV